MLNFLGISGRNLQQSSEYEVVRRDVPIAAYSEMQRASVCTAWTMPYGKSSNASERRVLYCVTLTQWEDHLENASVPMKGYI